MGINGVGYSPYVNADAKAAVNSRANYSTSPSFQSSDSRDKFTLNPAARSSELSETLKKTKKEQGFIGKLWDGFKNLVHIGAGSNKAQKAVEKFEKGEISEEAAIKAVEGYKKGQKQCVDMMADIASGIVSFAAYSFAGVALAPLTGGASLGLIAAGLGAAAVAGSATKVLIKGADSAAGGREYKGKDLLYDVATGSINGMFAPITAGIGGAVGKGVATKIGVQTGKEMLLKEGLKGTAKGALTKTLLTTNVAYTGGTALSRGIALCADIASNGCISGGVDSTVRYLAGDSENKSLGGLADEVKQGAIGGLIAAPIIGGGMRLAGKATSKAAYEVNKKLTFKKVMPDGLNTTFKQGDVGDCHLVSMIDSMMQNPKASEQLKKAIATTGDNNFQVKINNKIVNVTRESLAGSVLSDKEGIRIFEQAYKQLNNGVLDGGFADVVAKEFGLNPVHITKAGLTDEILNKIGKEQGNLTLSAGFETGGQRHYFSLRNIDTEKGIVTLVDPADTSKIVKKSLIDFKKELISLDGGSIGKTDLPNVARSADEAVFMKRKNKAAPPTTPETPIEESIAIGLRSDLEYAPKEILDVLNNTGYFDSAKLTPDAAELMMLQLQELDVALEMGAGFKPEDFLSVYERSLFDSGVKKIDGVNLNEVAKARKNNLGHILALAGKKQTLAGLDESNVIHLVGSDGCDKIISCVDPRIKGAKPLGISRGHNVPAGEMSELVQANLITKECWDAYLASPPKVQAVLEEMPTFQAFKITKEVGLDALDCEQKHKLTELFGDLFDESSKCARKAQEINPGFTKRFINNSNENIAKNETARNACAKIRGMAEAMKEISNEVLSKPNSANQMVRVGDEHFFLRLIDRDLIGSVDNKANFQSFESMMKMIKDDPALLSLTRSGTIVIEDFVNMSILCNYDNKTRDVILNTIFLSKPKLNKN